MYVFVTWIVRRILAAWRGCAHEPVIMGGRVRCVKCRQPLPYAAPVFQKEDTRGD